MGITQLFKTLSQTTALASVMFMTGLAKGEEHIVQEGESLSKIAQRYGVSVTELKTLNDIAHADIIKIGETIEIPSDNIYTVKQGDTLSKIAQRLDLPVEELIRLNNITKPDSIEIGQKLALPSDESYTVQSGDNFHKIAQKLGTTVKALKDANPQVTKPGEIDIGQKLHVPAIKQPATTRKASKTKKQEKKAPPAILPTQAACTQLLDFIGDIESNGDYDCVYQHKKVGDVEGYSADAKITDMTLDEVIAWQRAFVKQGSASSAAGKYQFLTKTLLDLKGKYNIPGDRQFSPDLQDRLAYYLLLRRGYTDYINGKISLAAFMKNTAFEWASIPENESGKSAYAGVGRNKALCEPCEIKRAIQTAYIAQHPSSAPKPTAP